MLLGLSGAYGVFSDSVTVKNHVLTGDVNIDVKEYQKKHGKEFPYLNPKEIFPGDEISKIPRITNYGMPCWVRTKISFGNSEKEKEGLQDKNLKGFSKYWKKIGEYYYYTKVLKPEKSTDIFTGISIPSNWTEVHSGQKLQIKIRTDAIQADNYKPDFHNMSPWGNETIEKCIHETNGKLDCKFEKRELNVKFHGKAHKLLAMPDDFFTNFGKIMPGDIQKDDIIISNTTDKETEIFFYTGIEKQTKQQLSLLEHLTLSISMDGKERYRGNLKASSLGTPISLGKFQPGSKGKLSFSISAPSTLKNTYALCDAFVNWTFAVNEKSTEKNNNSNDLQGTITGTAAVKTGDPVHLLELFLLLPGSLILCMVCIKRWKGGKDL